MLGIVSVLVLFFSVFLFVSWRIYKKTERGDPDIQALATATLVGENPTSGNNLAVVQKTGGTVGLKLMQNALTFGMGYTCLKDELLERFFGIVTEAKLVSVDETKHFVWKPINKSVMWKLTMNVEVEVIEEKKKRKERVNVEGYMAFRETDIPRELYESDNIVLPEGERLNCIENIEVVFGVYEKKEANDVVNELYFRLLEAVELTQLKRVEARNDKADIGLVYRVIRNKDSITLEGKPNGIEAGLPKEIINLSYAIPAVTIRGTQYSPTIEKRVEAWRVQLLAGLHLAFFGDTGTGKSRLLEYILSGIGRNTDVVFLDPQSLLLIAENPGLVTDKLSDPNRWTIFALDEAQNLSEDVVKALLQFMDGNLKLERASFILAMNDDPAKVDAALVREGRIVEVIKLLALSPHVIDQLATRIATLVPGRIKDLAKVKALAKTGRNPKLNEIWACAPLQQVTDKMVAILRS